MDSHKPRFNYGQVFQLDFTGPVVNETLAALIGGIFLGSVGGKSTYETLDLVGTAYPSAVFRKESQSHAADNLLVFIVVTESSPDIFSVEIEKEYSMIDNVWVRLEMNMGAINRVYPDIDPKTTVWWKECVVPPHVKKIWNGFFSGSAGADIIHFKEV